MSGADAVPPWRGPMPYSVKRHGVTVADCDTEPVRTPGCVQAHGALLVLRPGDLTVAQVSDNVEHLLGLTPQALLDQPVGRALGQAAEPEVRRRLAAAPGDGSPRHLLDIRGARGGRIDVCMHTAGGAVLLELEPAVVDGTPHDVHAALPDETLRRLQAVDGVQALCGVAAAEVRRLTGFDRVMVYRFHEDLHGEVVAEDRRPDLPAWLGLHYPAEDIPAPARDVFRRIWLRPVPDVAGGLSELVPLVNPDTGAALDMTHCVLRGPSVMYTEYLVNMQVRATATLSIRHGDRLWGLIACHHYTGPRFLGHAVRAICEMLAQVVSMLHRAAEERALARDRAVADAVYERLLLSVSSEGDLSTLIAGMPNMLDALPAGGAALRHGGRWWRAGETPSEPELESLADWLALRPEFQAAHPQPVVTDRLATHHPPAAAWPSAAGLLALPLSRRDRSLLLWFRPETIRTIHWGGNPHDMPAVPGPHGPRLSPRASFALFVESVRGRSLPWLLLERQCAERFRELLMELVAARAERVASLRDELVQANARQSRFLATLAHELRNPLAPLRNGLTLLRMGDLPPGPARSVAMMERQLTHLVDLVDDLLDVSRVSEGKIRLRRVRMPIRDALQAAIEATRPLLEQHHHQLRIDLADPGALVEADATRLAQIFTNLIGNAGKYTEPGGLIEILQSRQGDMIAVCVRDNGVGIAPEDLPGIWDMFTQVGRTLDLAQGGLGIGLSLTRKLVELHGGSVTAHSEGRGRGSAFEVRLPAAPERPQQPEQSEAEPPAQGMAASRRRVLVVDDNEDAAQTLAELIRSLGHLAEVALDGRSGIDVARLFTPDLALVDIGMPGIDGHAVARAVRADPRLASVRLVALTGWGSAEDKRKAAEAGFDVHLTKPVNLTDLLRLLSGVP